MPFSMAEVQPDFLVAAGYKWLLGPYGFGLLYISEKWRNSRPLEESWLARLNAQDFASLVNYSDTYMAGARRFDVGEKCTPTLLPGAIAALRQIKAWGVAEIAYTLSIINQTIAHELEQLGFRVPDESERCPHMFGTFLPQSYTGNLVNELKKKNIYISQRGNALRFAPHLHIHDYDVERLRGALHELLR
jgi:selenocysteine lyase/cysteine desulfurase